MGVASFEVVGGHVFDDVHLAATADQDGGGRGGDYDDEVVVEGVVEALYSYYEVISLSTEEAEVKEAQLP